MSQQNTEYNVVPDSPRHVVLFAMLRWFVRHKDIEHPLLAPDIVVLSAMREQEGPLRMYKMQRVRSEANSMKKYGLVEKVTYYDKTLGWTLTEKGLDAIEDLGRPGQYDH